MGLPWLRIGLGVAVVLVVGWLYVEIRGGGWDAALRAIGEQNEQAISDADLASFNLDDCNRARADGERVRFDFGTGRCVRLAPGR